MSPVHRRYRRSDAIFVSVRGLTALFAITIALLISHASLAAASVPGGDSRSPSAKARGEVADSVTWSSFTPSGWVRVPFSSGVTATSSVNLDPQADAYSVSTDGGMTWSPWSRTGLSTDIPNPTVHQIVVHNLSFPDSVSLNYIRFSVLETTGSQAISPAYPLLVDTTPPGPPTFMTGSPAQHWTNVNSFSESWRNPSDLSGVVGAYYKLDARPTSNTDGTYVNASGSVSDLHMPWDGRHDIYVWLVDAAGNIDHAAYTGDPDVFWYDGTSPVSSLVARPALPATGWYTTSVDLTFSATDLPVDPLNPAPIVYHRLDGGPSTPAPSVLTVSADGAHRVEYGARDTAGNAEPVRQFNFGIDRVAPTVTLQPDRLPGPTGWYTAPVTYTLTVTDLTSGAPRGFYRLNDGAWQAGPTGAPAVFTLAAEGSYRIEYYGADAAGNRSPVRTLNAGVDTTPPATGHTIEGVLGAGGWYISGVTVRLQGKDNTSGIGATHFRIDQGTWQTGTEVSLPASGVYALEYYSTDVAGNTEPPLTTQIMLDMVAPSAPADITAAPSGWTRTNSFTVQWNSPADLSGIAAAYYKLGDVSGGDAPTGPKDGQVISQTQSIEGLAVPAEGAYRLYLWLVDGAGNVDQTTAPTNGPILRWDATPPVTTPQVQGQPGVDNWWRSPVTITFTATDSASGIAALHYRVDAGTWQSTSKASAAILVDQADKHIVEYYAEDVAGNVEPVQVYTARLDFTAPAAPASVRVLPQGWTRFNSFHMEWPAVTDLSGIGGAYVKFDSAPFDQADGTFYSGSTQIDGVTAPSEGRHSVYVWLRDGAGNANIGSAVAITDSVWYDATPPVTVITPTAALGLDGWYIGPVTFDMSATDASSGLLGTRYQIDDGEVESAFASNGASATISARSSFVLSAEGRHSVRIWSIDRAGNAEMAHTYNIAIDTSAPSASFTGPAVIVNSPVFDVSWTGEDSRDGSGVASYDVQVRHGCEGTWQDWLNQTAFTSVRFDQGQRGHLYYFRLFARDRAGNRQERPGEAKVLVEPVLNGGFDAGNFTDWTVNGEPYRNAVVPFTGPDGGSTFAARLGSEEYGPSLPSATGRVPIGCATMSQPIVIPSLQQVRRPHLQFWYRVYTYDVLWSENLQSYGDWLDVRLTDDQGGLIASLLRAGNPTNKWGELYDTGWQIADVDLAPFAGRAVRLSFGNCNGPEKKPDQWLNTWSYVDNVQIYDNTSLYLPMLNRLGPPAAGPAAPASGDGAGIAAPAVVQSTESASTGEAEPLR